MAGVTEYHCRTDGVAPSSLPCARGDVELMEQTCKRVFKIPGELITSYASDIDSPIAMSLIKSLCEDADKAEPLILYFSCHGRASSDAGELYLLFADGGAIPSQKIIDIVKSSVDRALIIFDCCFAGASHSGDVIADFDEQKFSGITAVCSSAADRETPAGLGCGPGPFARLFSFAANVALQFQDGYLRVSTILRALQVLPVDFGEADRIGKLSPVCKNIFALDSAFPIVSPIMKYGTSKFSHKGYTFVAERMDSRDYRRLKVSVLPETPHLLTLEDIYSLVSEPGIIDLLASAGVARSVCSNMKMIGFPLSCIEFEYYPDAFSHQLNLPQLRAFWNNPNLSAPEISFGRCERIGSFRIGKVAEFEHVYKESLTKAIENDALCTIMSSLYKRAIFYMDQIAHLLVALEQKELDSLDFIACCEGLYSGIDSFRDDALDLPYPKGSPLLVSESNNLIGIAGGLANFMSIALSAERRADEGGWICAMRCCFDLAVASHERLIAAMSNGD